MCGTANKKVEDNAAVVFSAIGIYILSLAIPPATAIFTRFMYTHYGTPDAHSRSFLTREFADDQWAYAASLSAQILLGLYLFFGSKGLAVIWHRLRPLAQRPDDADLQIKDRPES